MRPLNLPINVPIVGGLGEFALRFARITRIREDKDQSQITTLAELRSLYERQFLTKSRRQIPHVDP
jgi:hypothetical protein